MSRSWYAEAARTAPTSAAEYAAQQADCLAQATDLTAMADELVSEGLALHDSSPRRRALLLSAQGLRGAANAWTDAAGTFGEWARNLAAEVGA